MQADLFYPYPYYPDPYPKIRTELRFGSLGSVRFAESSLECHSDEVALTRENASNGETVMEGEKVGHSYTPSLGPPIKRIALVCRSFPQKVVGEN